MTRFGDFQVLCKQTPSYPWCNLFYNQLIKTNHTDVFSGLSVDQTSAPVGVNPVCGIQRLGHDGSQSNIANIVCCALSIIVTLGLVFLTGRRKAAVGQFDCITRSCTTSSYSLGRIELRSFLFLYLLTLPFQLITTGSFLEQGTTPLVVLTGGSSAP